VAADYLQLNEAAAQAPIIPPSELPPTPTPEAVQREELEFLWTLPEDIKQYGVIDLAEIERLAKEDPANYQVIRGWEFKDEQGNPISQRMVILINAHTGRHPKNVEDPAKVLVEMIEAALRRRMEKWGNTRIPLNKGRAYFEIKPDTPFVFVYMAPNVDDSFEGKTYKSRSLYMHFPVGMRFGFWQGYVKSKNGSYPALLLPITKRGSASVVVAMWTLSLSEYHLTKLQWWDPYNLPTIPEEWFDEKLRNYIKDTIRPKLCGQEVEKSCLDSLLVPQTDPFNSLVQSSQN